MNINLIEELRKISTDEIKLLNNNEIFDSMYDDHIVKVKKYERFLKKDTHKHDTAQIFYMVLGNSVHKINDEEITLKEGELLFLNKNIVHELEKLDTYDIAIKISVEDEFLQKCTLSQNYLISFFLKTLFDDSSKMDFIRFKVDTIIPVQNILENMIYSMLYKEEITENTNIFYLDNLLLHIKNSYNKLKFSSNAKDIRLTIMVMQYIDENLKDGELKNVADTLYISPYTLSKVIKKTTGYNFKELLQIKKLDTALYLLNNTDMPITKIASSIGYENTSYFHKIFKDKYKVSPKKYRD